MVCYPFRAHTPPLIPPSPSPLRWLLSSSFAVTKCAQRLNKCAALSTREGALCAPAPHPPPPCGSVLVSKQTYWSLSRHLIRTNLVGWVLETTTLGSGHFWTISARPWMCSMNFFCLVPPPPSPQDLQVRWHPGGSIYIPAVHPGCDVLTQL